MVARLIRECGLDLWAEHMPYLNSALLPSLGEVWIMESLPKE